MVAMVSAYKFVIDICIFTPWAAFQSFHHFISYQYIICNVIEILIHFISTFSIIIIIIIIMNLFI